MRRLAVVVALSALLAPVLTSPAGAITNGRDKTTDLRNDQWYKGGFGTSRIDINNGERSCSGVFLSGDNFFVPKLAGNSWILTAASCFADDPAKDYHVPVGPPKKPATVYTANWWGTDAYPVKRLVPRPDRDLVLAEIDRVGGNDSSAHIAQSPPRAGETLTSAGFGRTAIDWAPLTEQLGQVTVNSVTATTVNVGGASSVCKGDSGGAVYRETDGRFEIVGVHGVSWQQGCFGSAESRNGSTEARVDDIYDWIRQQIPDFNYSCSQPQGYGTRVKGYGDHVIFYTTSNGSLRSMQQGSEAARAIGPSYYTIWRAPSAPPGASGWGGEVRVGPAGLKPDYHDGAEWNQTIWEVHRKTNAQDPFNDGDLRLWTDPYKTGIQDPPTVAKGGDKVGSGWQRYLDPAFRNQFTIDSEGRIYAVDANGALREFNWQPATKTWRNPAGDVIDTGWGKFDSITASGDGVLYARTPDGNLFRFQYDHTANTWTQWDKPAGTGWNAYTAITSPGGDILYGSGTMKSGKPVLRWHRYYSETDSWAPRDPDGLGAVLNDLIPWNNAYRVQATPNMCSLRR
jgi:hypothetical protein